MPLEDLLDMIRRRSFIPFKIVMLDDASYHIPHPELVMPGKRKDVIGITSDPTVPAYERTVIVDLLHISRLEPQGSAPSQDGNGQAG